MGDTGPGGGIVFYATTTPFDCGVDLNAKCTNLEAAPSDQGQTNWCSNTNVSLNVTSTAIGAGMSNTTKALTNCTSGAIHVAANYTTTTKDDWYLPSRDELNLMYDKRGDIGGFAAAGYWSSSEDNAYRAVAKGFFSGNQLYNTKDSTRVYVRPVRAF